ncbi:MAG: T9SS type A sorting domain-containing protein, partial [Sediminibacterium sp.]
DSSYTFEISKDSTSAGEKRFEITGPPPPPRQEDPIIATITPNPVHNQLGIRYSFREPLVYQISIHSIDGTLLLNKTFATSKNGFASIEAPHLKAGSYVAVIKAGKNYLLKLFIKL